ncbi:MAG: multicomponent Na+:H+ antiporter subunit E [Cognaticolwellia sp.]
MPRALIVFVVLLSTWLLWSGVYEPLTIGLGVASCAFVAWFTARLEPEPGTKTDLGFWFRLLLYLPWLLREILVANLEVAKVICTPRLPISPQMLRVPCGPKTPMGQALYANSITLTPGTITLDLRGNTVLVHALCKGSSQGEMDRRCRAVEGQS